MRLIGGKIEKEGKTYYFEVENLMNIQSGNQVVADTKRGIILVESVTEESIKEGEYIDILGKIIRIATEQDIKNNEKNGKDCLLAIEKCQELINHYHLNMKIVSASFTLDRKQLLFNFTSDERVDFRSLAKDLGSLYRTRIELRQIGARDKASIIGGIGPCGRLLCCSKFLYNFESVSINMAKNQNIALNPSKINGVCGRLLCCLKYEDDDYTQAKNQYKKENNINGGD